MTAGQELAILVSFAMGHVSMFCFYKGYKWAPLVPAVSGLVGGVLATKF